MIDKVKLSHSVKDSVSEELWSKYDFQTIINTASDCWDGKGILVKCNDFSMIFSKINYELLKVESFSII